MEKKRQDGDNEDELQPKRQRISLVPEGYVPHVPKSLVEKDSTARLIVILDGAQLETAKQGNEYQLLNSDDHSNFLKRKGRDPVESRPDITHQCLLNLMDSPLNKAGLLQVYIHTNKNVLIEINPSTRIPRTYKRFAGLMVQLLHKLSIRATSGSEKLLKVIKNPVTDHLPTGCKKIALSLTAPKLVDLIDFVPTVTHREPVCFVIGAFSHGHVNTNYVDESIAVSAYPLSGALVCAKVCSAFERHWGVL